MQSLQRDVLTLLANVDWQSLGLSPILANSATFAVPVAHPANGGAFKMFLETDDETAITITVSIAKQVKPGEVYP